MTKIVRSISIEYAIWENAKKLGLNLSKIAEDAIMDTIKTKQPSEFEEIDTNAWLASADMAIQNQAVEVIRAARETEKKCVEESRELWNETYQILKEQKVLPESVIARVKMRAGLFEQLKRERAVADAGRLKKQKEAEAKEMM